MLWFVLWLGRQLRWGARLWESSMVLRGCSMELSGRCPWEQ